MWLACRYLVIKNQVGQNLQLEVYFRGAVAAMGIPRNYGCNATYVGQTLFCTSQNKGRETGLLAHYYWM